MEKCVEDSVEKNQLNGQVIQPFKKKNSQNIWG